MYKNAFNIKEEALFLFGSGISFETGMPNTKDILEKILHDNWEKNNFTFKSTTQKKEQLFYAEIIAFVFFRLKELKKSLRLFRVDEEISYEDIYSTLIQILEYYNGLYNLATLPFLDEIWSKVQEISGYHENKIGDAILETITFFNWAIRDILLRTKNNLSPTKANIKGFDFFDRLERNNKISDVIIFSLNHDLLIENYLGELLDTPFEKYNGDSNLKVYKRELFDKSKKFHLYKLHGSANWFVPDKYPSFFQKDLFECNATENNLGCYIPEMSSDGYPIMPMILTGLGIKEYYYQQAIYCDLIETFRNKLKDTKTLFVSGYGWKDSGINNIIIDWLTIDKDRKIILFSEDISATNYKLDYNCGEKVPHNLLWRYWDNFIHEKRIKLISKWISKCDVDMDILPNLK